MRALYVSMGVARRSTKTFQVKSQYVKGFIAIPSGDILVLVYGGLGRVYKLRNDDICIE